MIATDDEPVILELLHDFLADMNLRIISARDAELGLDLIRQNRPQFVLLNVTFPKVSGMCLLEETAPFDPGIEVFLFHGAMTRQRPRGRNKGARTI